MFFGNDVMGNR